MSPTTSEKRPVPVPAQQRVQVGELAALALVAHPAPVRCAFQRRGRWNRKNVSPAGPPAPVAAYFAFSASMPSRGEPRPAARRRAASPRRASRKSVSRAKCRCSSRLARKRTSSASSSSSMPRALGEHRRHHHQRARGPAGCPRRSPGAAAACGVTSSVASQFTSADRQLAARPAAASAPTSAQPAPRRPHRHRARLAARTAASSAASRAIAPRYSGQRAAPSPGATAPAKRHAHPHRALELRHARVDQVVADVRAPVVVAAVPARGRSPASRDRRAAPPRSRRARLRLREPLDDVAVAVARGEVHAAVDVRPGPRAACARRRSCVSTNSRQSIAPRKRRLPMLLLIETWSAACCWFSGLHQLLDGQAATRPAAARSRSAAAPAPAPWPCSRRASSATNGLRHRRVRARHVGDHQDQALRVVLGGLASSGRPSASATSRSTRSGGDARADAAQVLDQRQAQHDRDGPQLAQRRAA